MHGAIDRATCQAARATASRAARQRCATRSRTASSFKEQVRQRAGRAASAGSASIRAGCASISTIDMPMQIAAEAAIADQITAIDGRRAACAGAPRGRGEKQRRIAGAGAERPTCCRRRSSRSIRTPATCARWSAAATFDASHFNRAVQAQRQPGSAFKPFVYAAALEAGYHAGDASSTTSNDPIATPQGAWTPEDEHSTRRSMSLRDRPAHVEQSRRRPAAAAGRHPAAPCSTRRRWASATCRACRRWRSAPAR